MAFERQNLAIRLFEVMPAAARPKRAHAELNRVNSAVQFDFLSISSLRPKILPNIRAKVDFFQLSDIKPTKAAIRLYRYHAINAAPARYIRLEDSIFVVIIALLWSGSRSCRSFQSYPT